MTEREKLIEAMARAAWSSRPTVIAKAIPWENVPLEVKAQFINSQSAALTALEATHVVLAKAEHERALLAEREKFQICGYQRRLKWQTPEAEWFSCSTREATDPFESVPSFEYRAVYTAIRSPAHE